MSANSAPPAQSTSAARRRREQRNRGVGRKVGWLTSLLQATSCHHSSAHPGISDLVLTITQLQKRIGLLENQLNQLKKKDAPGAVAEDTNASAPPDLGTNMEQVEGKVLDTKFVADHEATVAAGAESEQGVSRRRNDGSGDMRSGDEKLEQVPGVDQVSAHAPIIDKFYTVVKPFFSDDKSDTRLPTGSRCKVLAIDDDGDARVAWRGPPDSGPSGNDAWNCVGIWVYSQRFGDHLKGDGVVD